MGSNPVGGIFIFLYERTGCEHPATSEAQRKSECKDKKMTQRTERLAELIKREIGDLILRGIKDSRLKNKLTSITHVELSNDLQHAKVFVSVYGNDNEQQKAIDGLKSASGFIRSEIGKRIRMRFTPQLLFQLDNSIKQGMKVIELMNKIKSEEKK